MKNIAQICPVVPSQLSHMPRICLSVSRNFLLIILLQGLWLSRGIIFPNIKGPCIGLDQNYVPTYIVRIRSAIFLNLFFHLDGNSLVGIITWSSEGLLLITYYNYYIYISPAAESKIHMKKPSLMVTFILCPSNLVKCPVIPWPFFTNSELTGVLRRFLPTKILSIPLGCLTLAERSVV